MDLVLGFGELLHESVVAPIAVETVVGAVQASSAAGDHVVAVPAVDGKTDLAIERGEPRTQRGACLPGDDVVSRARADEDLFDAGHAEVGKTSRRGRGKLEGSVGNGGRGDEIAAKGQGVGKGGSNDLDQIAYSSAQGDDDVGSRGGVALGFGFGGKPKRSGAEIEDDLLIVVHQQVMADDGDALGGRHCTFRIGRGGGIRHYHAIGRSE